MAWVPHIVIVGGGAGGLELATRLGNSLGRYSKAKITLIDSRLTHVWKPLLHEIAAGSLYPHDIEVSFLEHANKHYFNFELGAFEKLHRDVKEIQIAPIYDNTGQMIIPARALKYDFLIIAVGSVSNDFNVAGVAQHGFFLDNPKEAERFHKIFLYRWLGLRNQMSETKPQLNIVIVGGGATGVELAAELRATTETMLKYDATSRFIAKEQVKISIIENSPRLTPMLPETLSKKVAEELQELQIKIYTSENVIRVDQNRVFTRSGLALSADMVVWAAGIKAADFLRDIDGLETTPRNQLMVKSTLQTSDPHIFALGDCAACPQPDSNLWMPPRAQVAHQQAFLLAKSLEGYLEGKPLQEFQFEDYGSLVSISHRAVGNLMQVLARSWMIEGRLAKWIYLSLYQSHLIALHGVCYTVYKMIANVFSRRIKPKLKLH